MNKRDAGLQVGGNRLFLIFCFFCIKTKEKDNTYFTSLPSHSPPINLHTFGGQKYCKNLLIS